MVGTECSVVGVGYRIQYAQITTGKLRRMLPFWNISVREGDLKYSMSYERH